YRRAADYARTRGIIIADTKFEWGKLPNGDLILIDEVLTPDSSRFWPAAEYQVGKNPPSFDKQFVRDWLETTGWDKNSPPPELPAAVVEQTRAKYLEAYEKLTGKRWHEESEENRDGATSASITDPRDPDCADRDRHPWLSFH